MLLFLYFVQIGMFCKAFYYNTGIVVQLTWADMKLFPSAEFMLDLIALEFPMYVSLLSLHSSTIFIKPFDFALLIASGSGIQRNRDVPSSGSLSTPSSAIHRIT